MVGTRRVEAIPWLPGIGFDVTAVGSLMRRLSLAVTSRSPLLTPVWCQSGCTAPTEFVVPPSSALGSR